MATKVNVSGIPSKRHVVEPNPWLLEGLFGCEWMRWGDFMSRATTANRDLAVSLLPYWVQTTLRILLAEPTRYAHSLGAGNKSANEISAALLTSSIGYSGLGIAA